MSMINQRRNSVSLLGAALMVVLSLCLVSLVPGAAGGSLLASARGCRVPKLTGLTLMQARKRARRAGCEIRLAGAAVERSAIQTVAKQSPRVGAIRRSVTLWINPVCAGKEGLGPPEGEPLLTPGPSELISGLFVDGGPPPVLISAPKCPTEGVPEGGTIVVANSAGTTIATQTVVKGHLAKFPLSPGTYTITGTMEGQHSEAGPIQVTIPTGETVRQDLSWSIL